MKNLKIIESCLVQGQHEEAGTILKNVDNSIAAQLIVSGKAVIINGTQEVQSRDPKPENRDPKRSKKSAPQLPDAPPVTDAP